jgi:hypothetical protein
MADLKKLDVFRFHLVSIGIGVGAKPACSNGDLISVLCQINAVHGKWLTVE